MFSAMPDAQVVEWIREKYTAIVADLDERARRRWGAAEARSLGWGGIQAVAVATGLSDRTIRDGIKELADPDALPATQQRRSGGGRKRRESEQPQLIESLQQLVDSGTRGDPMSPLRWTCKSTRTLAEELSRQGFSVSANTVGRLLYECGYSLQATLPPTCACSCMSSEVATWDHRACPNRRVAATVQRAAAARPPGTYDHHQNVAVGSPVARLDHQVL